VVNRVASVTTDHPAPIFMAVGGLVFAVGAWLLALGRDPVASDTGARPRVRVTGAYVVRPASPNEVPVYFRLRNTGGGADRLLGVRTDVSTVVMMHRGVQMVSVDSVAVPAHGAVAFTPRGLHVMLMEPKRVLRAGDAVRLTLLFSRSDPQTISAPVIAAGARPPDG
jgi:copper(I)-binding protein